MSIAEILESGKYVIAVMGKDGDSKIMWDPNNRDEVEAARTQFNTLVKDKKFMAFAVNADGSKGEKVSEFNPTQEKYILSPALVGG